LKRSSIILYFLLACLISWSAKFCLVSAQMGQSSFYIPLGILQLIAQYGPSLAGVVMIFSESGKKGMINLFKNLTRLNIHYKWILFAIFFELSLFHLVLLYSTVSGYGNIIVQTDSFPESYVNFFLNAIILSILTGLGEEIGWRGYLLPKLQLKYKILAAALVLSVLNSLWHLSNESIAMILQNDLEGFSRMYFPDMGLRILITIPVIFVLIYIFNETKGSLGIMILFHGTANASYEWLKEMTGIPDPEFLLPVFTVILWITSIYFIPAVLSQARHKKLVTQL
jgi:hypothetical protein